MKRKCFSPAALILGALAGTGCQEPSAGLQLDVHGRTVDTKGSPVPHVGVEALLQGSEAAVIVRTRSESTGRYRLHVKAEQDPAAFTTLSLHYADSGLEVCMPGYTGGHVSRKLNEVAGSIAPSITVDFIMTPRPRGRLDLGQLCAYQESDSGSDVWIVLDVQSVEPIRGRWRMDYRTTRSSDGGEFSGVAEGDRLTLSLTTDQTAMCKSAFVLTMPIAPDGYLGAGSYTGPEDCHPYPGRFRFVRASVNYFWP